MAAERQLPYVNPDTGIDKPGVRAFANEQLQEAHSKVWRKLASVIGSSYIDTALGYRSDEEKAAFSQTVQKIQETGEDRINAWRQGYYQDDRTFDEQIESKAYDYARNGGADPVKNYEDGLGNRHDQAVAAPEFFQEFADRVNAIEPITDHAKDEAAYFLAEKIRNYGTQLADPETLPRMIELGVVTQEEFVAMVRSGVLAVSGVEPEFNKTGFKNDDEWDKAVYKTAAGLLEDKLLKQISDLANIDEDKEIYDRAQEIYQQRIDNKLNPVIPSTTTASHAGEKSSVNSLSEGDRILFEEELRSEKDSIAPARAALQNDTEEQNDNEEGREEGEDLVSDEDSLEDAPRFEKDGEEGDERTVPDLDRELNIPLFLRQARRIEPDGDGALGRSGNDVQRIQDKDPDDQPYIEHSDTAKAYVAAAELEKEAKKPGIRWVDPEGIGAGLRKIFRPSR